MLGFIRSSDSFGTGLRLSVLGKQDYQTVVGGLASLSFKVMILVFLCVKILAVVSYKDPQISGYTIYEQRAHMQEPVNFAEMNV